MFQNKLTNLLLNITPQKHWNVLSNLLCRLSLPTIGSPIAFSYNDFVLKEYYVPQMDTALREKFLHFCYPADMHDRAEEILIDHQYWNDAATFVVFNKAQEIVGCMQFIPKTEANKIPVEFAHVVNDSDACDRDFDIHQKTPFGKFAESYRCRRSPELKGDEAVAVVSMLFKATWAKTVQTKTEYIYITYRSGDRGLQNLYSRKLNFQNPGIAVQFGNSPDRWTLLVKDCRLHERAFATLSKPHFFLQTWVRKNCKKKNLNVPAQAVAPHFLSEEDTVLFASVQQAKKRKATRRMQSVKK
ncbi:MAG: hypothetical protein PHC61_16355 [Chitinivibrionales bacterium]|nr:hypothetical protein [Chitinivibrionales bacterium]